MLKKISKYLPHILAMLFVAGFAVFAWTEPASAPPAGNVATPINISATEQIKSGNLTVNALGISASGNALLVPNGSVGIGTASPGSSLTVNGIIESLTGGIKFPDGTVQTTSPPSGSPMANWINFSGNCLIMYLHFSDPSCSNFIGYRVGGPGGSVLFNVNNNSLSYTNIPNEGYYWMRQYCGNTGECQSQMGPSTFVKCSSGLDHKYQQLDTSGFNMAWINYCVKP